MPKLDLEHIRRNGYAQADRSEVEKNVANKVETDPEYFLAQYLQDERSLIRRQS